MEEEQQRPVAIGQEMEADAIGGDELRSHSVTIVRAGLLVAGVPLAGGVDRGIVRMR